MASQISSSDLSLIFKKLDKNDDGFVSLEELMSLLETLGCNTSLAELGSLVGKTNLDYVNFLFFYDVIIKGSDGSSGRHGEMEEEGNSVEKDLEEAFKVFDLNGDGFISSEEIQSALCKLGLWDDDQPEKDCKKMLSYYDTNSDGKIDLQEFKNMMSFTR